jgi:teichuronic acid biosynthesis glycosyltransferase TuaH
LSSRALTSQEFQRTVVIAAANNWDGVRMADRQLAESLSAICPVLYVDPPTSPASLWREGRRDPSALRPTLSRIGPQLARLTPVVAPGLTRPQVAELNLRLIARQVRKALKDLGGTAYAVIESSVLIPIAGRCGEERTVYWAQDDFAGGAALLGLSAERLARGEQKLIASVDTIIAANPLVRDSIVRAGRQAELIPYGCDAELFATTAHTTPAPGVRLPGPVAGFMGHLGDRIDLEMLTAVADLGVSLLLVGPKHARSDQSALEDLLGRSNVQWVGARDFEELPAWLAHMHVGLLPYNHSAFNQGSFPLKTLEYLAAGVPVVASDLPAIRWLDSDQIVIADTPKDFAEAVGTALAQPRTPEGDGERRRFAGRHTWDHRARAFAQALDLVG